jgi:hypothetical protein
MNIISPSLLVRVHLTDGSVESFLQDDAEKAAAIRQRVDPARLFAQQRIVIAGTHSKSVFVCSEIVRIDFLQEGFTCWEFPQGYSDLVELSETEFREHALLDQPDLMPQREVHTPVGDLLISFLKLQLRGSPPIFLMAEFSVKLPIENQAFMRFMLSKAGFHMRLSGGGVSVVNLANLAGYTVYPGVAQIPADAWLAEPTNTANQLQQ